MVSDLKNSYNILRIQTTKNGNKATFLEQFRTNKVLESTSDVQFRNEFGTASRPISKISHNEMGYNSKSGRESPVK